MMVSAGVDNAIETGRNGLRRAACGAGGNFAREAKVDALVGEAERACECASVTAALGAVWGETSGAKTDSVVGEGKVECADVIAATNRAAGGQDAARSYSPRDEERDRDGRSTQALPLTSVASVHCALRCPSRPQR